MSVLIIVPVLRRPHRVQPTVESIEAATPEPHRTLFIATPGDDEELSALKDAGAEWIETPEPYTSGDYAKKINLAYRATWEPLLFLAADDLHFHEGWFEKAYEKLAPGIGVVGTNDLCNRRTRRQHSTHSLVTRSYVDLYGTIDERHKVLHEGYHHVFCDDELIATADHRGAYVHTRDCYVEHLHPDKQRAPRDATYDHGVSRFQSDRRLFEQREHLWR